jgi:mono/diheme cytochrome c family protein
MPSVAPAEEVGEVRFPQHIAIYFQTHCIKCHGPDKQEAEMRLDGL